MKKNMFLGIDKYGNAVCLKSLLTFENIRENAENIEADDFCSVWSTADYGEGREYDNISDTLDKEKLSPTMERVKLPPMERVKLPHPVAVRPDFHVEEIMKVLEYVTPETSQYKGIVGKPWMFEVKSCRLATTWSSGKLYVLEDQQGCVFTIKTRCNLENICGNGRKTVIRGIVKKHTEYRGVKQTWFQYLNTVLTD